MCIFSYHECVKGQQKLFTLPVAKIQFIQNKQTHFLKTGNHKA